MALTDDDARHLISRTGMGTPPDEIGRVRGLSRSKAVDVVMNGTAVTTTVELPDWADEPIRPREVMMAAMNDPKEVQQLLNSRGIELKMWWYRQMLETRSPFTERMTLFWHNHFTSATKKVRRPALMLAQNQMLRRNSVGRFDKLLRDVLHDPAMLVYLDNNRNVAGKPNENLARELMELFTLGEGNYTEQDVKEAARALTGWTVNRRNGEFRNARWKHDTGTKKVLGSTGAHDGNSLVDVLLNPQCARYIAAKLRSEFITTAPRAGEVERFAKSFREASWDIATLVRTILTSDAFWAPQNRGTRIKSPVELTVGTVRTLQLDVPALRAMVQSGRALGQDIFDPPNVKGWPGAEAWITSNTLLRRMAILERAGKLETKIQDIGAWLGDVYAGKPQSSRIEAILLAVPPITKIDTTDVRKQVQEILLDPAFQVS